MTQFCDDMNLVLIFVDIVEMYYIGMLYRLQERNLAFNLILLLNARFGNGLDSATLRGWTMDAMSDLAGNAVAYDLG